MFVNIIKSISSLFSITGKSKKESKGWWCEDIKKAGNDLKNAKNWYKKAMALHPKCSSWTQGHSPKLN